MLATFNFGDVQGFVTDLCYGSILVLSLLLTLALPHLQHWLRYISPLLVFVVLGLAFVGVALHAKFDYSDLSYTPPVKGAPAADQSTATGAGRARRARRMSIRWRRSSSGPSRRRILRARRFRPQSAQLAILLLAVVVALRLLVWQASKGAVTPVIYAALGVPRIGRRLAVDARAALHGQGRQLKGATMVDHTLRSTPASSIVVPLRWLGLAVAAIVAGVGAGLGFWQQMPALNVIFYTAATFAIVALAVERAFLVRWIGEAARAQCGRAGRRFPSRTAFRQFIVRRAGVLAGLLVAHPGVHHPFADRRWLLLAA